MCGVENLGYLRGVGITWGAYDKPPARQLQCYAFAAWEWSHHTRQIYLFEHGIRTQEDTDQMPIFAWQVVLSRMEATVHAGHRTPQPDFGLVNKNPMRSIPAF